MSVTADQLRDLLALGLAGETLLAVVTIFERDAIVTPQQKAAIRAKNYRDRQRDAERDAVTRDASVTDETSSPSASPSSSSPAPPLITTPSPTPTPSAPDGAAAGAARDIRADLFDTGLKTLARITGKTPDSCRALVGRLLKSVNDEAIHVLGAIEDADRNRVADPVAWITRVLAPRSFSQQRAGPAPRPGSKEDNRERTADALRKLTDFIDVSADEPRRGGPTGEDDAGRLRLFGPPRS